MRRLILVGAVLMAAVMEGVAAPAVTNDWENPLVNAINREPARAYAFPLADAKAALTEELPESPYVKSLNGNWKFNWCGCPSLRPLDFWKVDFDDSAWALIDVPSCVEMRGYGVPHYSNILYPHKNNPPFQEADYNPVSSYRTTFTVPENWAGRRVFIRFDGVYSAYYVWINGQKVGYSEDSKLPGEFDISPYLKKGNNLLAVEVYRWSDGSYVEDQDMFRFSGIFRDVSLFATPMVELNDFYVTTTFADAQFKDATLNLAIKARSLNGKAGDAKVEAKLYDADYKEVATLSLKTTLPATRACAEAKGTVPVASPRLWSAEDPYLYTLVMALTAADGTTDIRSCKVGFKKVEVVEKTVGKNKIHAIHLNGQPVKFLGVNRHETSPENGRTVTKEEMLKDVLMFKKYNINTVRMSHYPNHPYFYHLCNRYGIYIVAEANVESHEWRWNGKNGGFGYRPDWKQTIVERNANHVTNYRNQPAIFMWSLGNECGPGPNFEAANAAIKALDPTRPTHYTDDACVDVEGKTYVSVENLWMRGWKGEKPFFHQEYAHAMGNAIGNLEEYLITFYTTDVLAGGCIWDWVDQAVWKDTGRLDENGKQIRILAYGGDHDDEPNQGPFCCNGVVDPFRNVTPKLLEVAHCYRKLRVRSTDAATGKAELENRFCFTHADAFAGRWTLTEDGTEVAFGTFDVPAVAPLSRKTIELPLPKKLKQIPGAEYFYTVSFALKNDTPWAKKGHVIAHDQLPFKNSVLAGDKSTSPSTVEKLVATEDATRVTVKGTKLFAVFSRATGTLSKLEMAGKEILADKDGVVFGPQLDVLRAFTDNDVWIRNYEKINYYKSGLTQPRYHPEPMRVVCEPDGSVRVFSTVTMHGAKSAGFTHESRWLFKPCGTITVDNTVTPFGLMPPVLCRLGTAWKLDPSLEKITWFGRGPHENYIDRKTSADIGLWESTVTDQYVPYVRPQDCGSKSDVRWVALTDKSGDGVLFKGSQPLFVQALHYDFEDLEFARHRSKQPRWYTPLVPREEVCLNLDIRQLGLGNRSCGPEPLNKVIDPVQPQSYTFPIQKEMWSLTLKPISSGFFTRKTAKGIATLAR